MCVKKMRLVSRFRQIKITIINFTIIISALISMRVLKISDVNEHSWLNSTYFPHRHHGLGLQLHCPRTIKGSLSFFLQHFLRWILQPFMKTHNRTNVNMLHGADVTSRTRGESISRGWSTTQKRK